MLVKWDEAYFPVCRGSRPVPAFPSALLQAMERGERPSKRRLRLWRYANFDEPMKVSKGVC